MIATRLGHKMLNVVVAEHLERVTMMSRLVVQACIGFVAWLECIVLLSKRHLVFEDCEVLGRQCLRDASTTPWFGWCNPTLLNTMDINEHLRLNRVRNLWHQLCGSLINLDQLIDAPFYCWLLLPYAYSAWVDEMFHIHVWHDRVPLHAPILVRWRDLAHWRLWGDLRVLIVVEMLRISWVH